MKLIEVSKAKLRDYRDRERPRPHLDDKILTCWNGLMVSCVHCDSNTLIYIPCRYQDSRKPLKYSMINTSHLILL